MSKHNSKMIHHPEIRRVLSKDKILPGTQVDVQIIAKNTAQHPIESLYIVEGEIQPANETEIFSPDFIESRIFTHQGIMIPGAMQEFYYTIRLHPYSTTEHVTIGEMRVEFIANDLPVQMTIPEVTIEVENLPVDQLEISEGYYNCPNCGEKLELDTVLCTNCGFEIGQMALQKIWATQKNHEKLIEEEILQREEETPQREVAFQREEETLQKQDEILQKEIAFQREEEILQGEVTLQRGIAYLKKAAQFFQEENFDKCLLSLKQALQIINQSDPTMLQSKTDEVVRRLLTNILEYDGLPISKRTAATSLKFSINLVKSLRNSVN